MNLGKKSVFGIAAGAALMITAFQPQAAKAAIYDYNFNFTSANYTASGVFAINNVGNIVVGISGVVTSTNALTAGTDGAISGLLYEGNNSANISGHYISPLNPTTHAWDYNQVLNPTNPGGYVDDLGVLFKFGSNIGNIWLDGSTYNFSVDTPNALWNPGDLILTGGVGPGVVAAVPEASTWAMIVLGFLGLGFIANRRTRASLRIV